MTPECRFDIKTDKRIRRSFFALFSLGLFLSPGTFGYAQCSGQKEQVKYFKSVFALVLYDFHMTSPGHFDPNARPKDAAADIDETYRVTFIDLDNNNITDATLQRLKCLPDLEYVHISNTKITNEGIKHLKDLKKIRVLTLNNEGIDDRALTHIGELSSLEELFIDHADITDVGLLRLKKLKNLKKLNLVDPSTGEDITRFTEEGLHRLKDALPNCEIILL